MSLDVLAAFAAGYFIGGLPFAAYISRLMNKDIFAVGSGNMGSMNTARNIGWLPGIAVLVLDIGKGAMATTVGIEMANLSGGNPFVLALAAAVGAVIGHAWSPYVAFRGGKALASAFGATLPVLPWVGPAALVLLISLILLTRRANLGTIMTLVLFPFLTSAVLFRQAWPADEILLSAIATALMGTASIIKHARAPKPPTI